MDKTLLSNSVYGPTTDAEEEEIDKFYNQTQSEISITDKQDVLLVVHKLGMLRKEMHLAGLANRNEGE